MGTSCGLGGLQRPLSINTSVIPHPAPTRGQAAEVTLPAAGTAVCFPTPEQLKQQDEVPTTQCATPQQV